MQIFCLLSLISARRLVGSRVLLSYYLPFILIELARFVMISCRIPHYMAPPRPERVSVQAVDLEYRPSGAWFQLAPVLRATRRASEEGSHGQKHVEEKCWREDPADRVTGVWLCLFISNQGLHEFLSNTPTAAIATAASGLVKA